MKNQLVRALAFVLFVLLAGTFSSQVQAFDIPKLQAHVNDYANLITSPKHTELEDVLTSLEKKTTAQVVILTVPNLQGEDLESYSMEVAHTWALGQKGKDNGLLILYATQEDRYRIEVGYGLEGAIPDGLAGGIIREQLRAKADPGHGTKDFDSAFTGAVQKISGIILSEYAKDPTGENMKGKLSPGAAATITTVIVAALVGLFDEMVGLIIGLLTGLVLGTLFSIGIGYIILLGIFGAVVGVVAKTFIQAMLSGDGGGSSGSSSSGGSYSGGGGSFGGGGASG